jgi:hypothetical protein
VRSVVEIDHSPAAEGRMSHIGMIVLVGGSGAMFVTMCVIVFGMGQRMWPVWVFWAASLLLLAIAMRDAFVTRVLVTGTHLFVKRGWTSRSIPLSELRAIRVVKAEYVVETAQRNLVWIPMFLTNRHAIIARLQLALAANVVKVVLESTPHQHEIVREKSRS